MFLKKKAQLFGNKTDDQRFGANSKNVFFATFCCKFLAFLKLFSTKNAENDYFNQRSECAVPKRWSKYTTVVFVKLLLIIKLVFFLNLIITNLNPHFIVGKTFCLIPRKIIFSTISHPN